MLPIEPVLQNFTKNCASDPIGCENLEEGDKRMAIQFFLLFVFLYQLFLQTIIIVAHTDERNKTKNRDPIDRGRISGILVEMRGLWSTRSPGKLLSVFKLSNFSNLK